MNKLTLDEMLLDVISRLSLPRWNYAYKVSDWFRPDDIAPHSTQFKYRCKKLYKAGLLDRSEYCGRWGYQYRIIFSQNTNCNKECFLGT